MDHAAVMQKVIALTSEELGADAAALTEQTAFKDLGADSFDLLELVTAFEDEFGSAMDEDALPSIVTLGDAARAIEAALA